MRRSNKSKRISWAPDVNLCQVRLFLSEESPSQVGLGAQDHLQAKSSWLSHSNGVTADDTLPPGFEGPHSTSQSLIRLSDIPVNKWKCPPRFGLNFDWQVVAGEESKEVEVQKQREVRVLEAFYPNASAIPLNPSVSVDIENQHHNDQQTPLIPITPIEDEDASTEASSEFTTPFNIPVSSQPSLVPHGILPAQCSKPNIPNTSSSEKPAAGRVLNVEPDIIAAASAAFTAIAKSNDNRNLIDHELLVKILSNPKLMENLVTDHGTASNGQSIHKPTSPSVPLSEPLRPVISLDPSTVHIHRTESRSPPVAATSSDPFYPHPNWVAGPPPNAARVPPLGTVPIQPPPSLGVPQAKDVNYYKNLIQQHGGDRQEPMQQFSSRYHHHPGPNQEVVNNLKPRDLKPKIMKPCIYFNSSRGCRHGANCAYQHDASTQQRSDNMPEVQNAKRMKLDREISS